MFSQKNYSEALSFMDIAGGFAIILDKDGQIQFVNKHLCEVLGYEAKELRGRFIWDIINEKGREGLHHFLLKTDVRGVEVLFLSQDQSSFPVLFSSSIVKSKKGDVEQVVCMAQDMQSYKDIEFEKKEINEQVLLTEKMAALGLVAAGVAHEINNPLGFITCNVSTIKGDLPLLKRFIEITQEVLKNTDANDDFHRQNLLKELQGLEEQESIQDLYTNLKDMLEESHDGLRRMADIVKNLSKFARYDDVVIDKIDINECMRTTLNVLANELKYKCEVKADLGDLPEISCAPGKVNQVFMNLILNAAQALQDSGQIVIKTTHERNQIVVTVKDNGPGIAPDLIDKIFTPFFTTKPIGEGTGLGLYIAYGIVEEMNGSIEVESEMGKGTTFKVIFPFTNQPDSFSKDKLGDQPLKPLKDKTILVVDDDEYMRDLIKELLKDNGAKIMLAQNGVEGLKLYEDHKDNIDAVILDILMPIMSGVQIFHYIDSHDRKAKIVFCSGSQSRFTVRGLLDKENVYFLQKPFRPNEILSLLQEQ